MWKCIAELLTLSVHDSIRPRQPSTRKSHIIHYISQKSIHSAEIKFGMHFYCTVIFYGIMIHICIQNQDENTTFLLKNSMTHGTSTKNKIKEPAQLHTDICMLCSVARIFSILVPKIFPLAKSYPIPVIVIDHVNKASLRMIVKQVILLDIQVLTLVDTDKKSKV